MNTIRIYRNEYSGYQANTNPMTDIPEPSRFTLNGNGLVPSGEWIEARAYDALKAELARLKSELEKAQRALRIAERKFEQHLKVYDPDSSSGCAKCKHPIGYHAAGAPVGKCTVKDCACDDYYQSAGDLVGIYGDEARADQAQDELAQVKAEHEKLIELFRDSVRDINPHGKTILDLLNVWLDQEKKRSADARLFADDAKRHVKALADAILVMFGPYTIADIHGNILIAADELDQAVDSARSAREWLEGKKAEGERMKAEGTHD